MVDYNLIRTSLNRQKEQIFNKKLLVKRQLLKEMLSLLKDKRIIIISGMRRVGKSTLLKEIMLQLNLENKKYCYVNFEDECFLNFNAKDFEKLNEILTEIYGN